MYPWLITDIHARLDNKQHLKEISDNMKKTPGTTTQQPFTDILTWKVGSHTAWYLKNNELLRSF